MPIPGPGRPHLHSWPSQLRPPGPRIPTHSSHQGPAQSSKKQSLPSLETLPDQRSTLPSARWHSRLLQAWQSQSVILWSASSANLLSLGDAQGQGTRGGKSRWCPQTPTSRVHPQAPSGARGERLPTLSLPLKVVLTRADGKFPLQTHLPRCICWVPWQGLSPCSQPSPLA